jgi:hypothetical protein
MHPFEIPTIRNPERLQNQGQRPNRLSRSVVLLLLRFMPAGLGDKAPPICGAGRLSTTSGHDIQYTELSGELITARGHVSKLTC